MESAKIFVVEVGIWTGLKEDLGQTVRGVSFRRHTSVMEMVALRADLFVHCPLAIALPQRGTWEGGFCTWVC